MRRERKNYLSPLLTKKTTQQFSNFCEVLTVFYGGKHLRKNIVIIMRELSQFWWFDFHFVESISKPYLSDKARNVLHFQVTFDCGLDKLGKSQGRRDLVSAVAHFHFVYFDAFDPFYQNTKSSFALQLLDITFQYYTKALS